MMAICLESLLSDAILSSNIRIRTFNALMAECASRIKFYIDSSYSTDFELESLYNLLSQGSFTLSIDTFMEKIGSYNLKLCFTDSEIRMIHNILSLLSISTEKDLYAI